MATKTELWKRFLAAVEEVDLDELRSVIAGGLEVNGQYGHHRLPPTHAVAQLGAPDSLTLLSFLIGHGARLDGVDAGGREVIHYAIDCEDTLRCVLDAGADVDSVDMWGKTPLWVVVFRLEPGAAPSARQAGVIRLLLERGADPEGGSAPITPGEMAREEKFIDLGSV